jgi:flagellar basal body P-ring protein FlgI
MEFIEIKQSLLASAPSIAKRSQKCQDLYQQVLQLLDKCIINPNDIVSLCQAIRTNEALYKQVDFEINQTKQPTCA